MGKGGRDGPIAGIMRTSGREKWRVLAAKGASTFLLLDGAARLLPRGPASPARPDAEGAALGALAGDIYRGLSPAERGAWPGGVALALQMLADRSFSAAGPLASTRPEDDGPDEGPFRAFREGRYVRVVNFHATPRRLAGGLEEQLTRLARSFAPVSYDDLVGLVGRGEWPHYKPGVILSFFDGFRDNYEVAAPILDRLGLVGWFFLVSGWISAPPEDQRAFADRHFIDLPYDEHDLPADGRLALSSGEISALADRGHVIASHTRTHSAAPPGEGPEALAREAGGSKKQLEGISGAAVGALAWCEGVALGENPLADAALRDAGYELLFANHAVQRVR